MAKRILFLVRLYHPHMGGVESHVTELARELISRGYQLTILTEQYEFSLPESEIYEQVRIIRVPLSKLASKWSLWRWMIEHRSLFFQAEIIHIHDVFWWLLPLSPFLRQKSFITFHGYEGVEAPNWRQKMWHRLGAMMTSGNICIGGFHEKWYSIRSDTVSFGAVRLPDVRSILTRSGSKRIAYVGRLAEDVGITTYLKGFAQLTKNQPNWVLDVYGDGPQLSDCVRYVSSRGLRVKFKGWVPGVSKQLSTYDVIYVSRYLGILESLAQGKRVVAVYNNQIKFDYLTLTPFAQWIEIVCSPSEVAKATICAQAVEPSAIKWARAQTWEAMADEYIHIWGRPR